MGVRNSDKRVDTRARWDWNCLLLTASQPVECSGLLVYVRGQCTAHDQYGFWSALYGDVKYGDNYTADSRALELSITCFANSRRLKVFLYRSVSVWRQTTDYYDVQYGMDALTKATPISCRKKIRKTIAFSPIRTRKEIQENHEFPGIPPVLQWFPLLK